MRRKCWRFVALLLVIGLWLVVLLVWMNQGRSDDDIPIDNSLVFGHKLDIQGGKPAAYPTRAHPPVLGFESVLDGHKNNPAVQNDALDNRALILQNFKKNVAHVDNIDKPAVINNNDINFKQNLLPHGMRTPIPKLPGQNVISMTLYGSSMRYTMGAIRNAELAKVNFPGWQLRVYTETPSENPKYGLVPQTVLDTLRNLGADIHFMEAEEDFVPPMMWRFLVADDTWIDHFIVRDADARLIERDALAVHEWIKSGKVFNCMRDHPSHASYAVSGGMWGGKPQPLLDLLRRPWREMMRGVRKDYLSDMNFLNHVIWPKVEAFAYCSDSVSCDKYVNAHPFPVVRYGYEHIGQVYDEHDLGRPIDISILRQAGENPVCKPKDNLLDKLKELENKNKTGDIT